MPGASTGCGRTAAAPPGTYIWLAPLFGTTVALHHMPPESEEELLRQWSTVIRWSGGVRDDEIRRRQRVLSGVNVRP
ncbi:rhomboid-like protein [Streptomyces sp. NPDC002817]|uniref:rhomboid-like protein n=1 Tax=Streptomyces sp. NPDC088357 TaxID=3154655 RepID=UPI0034186D24